MAKLTRKLSQVGQEALERLELPVNLAGGVARIELLGNREVYMDRHCGVLAYTTENIDVNGGSVVVRFFGRELRLLLLWMSEASMVLPTPDSPVMSTHELVLLTLSACCTT